MAVHACAQGLFGVSPGTAKPPLVNLIAGPCGQAAMTQRKGGARARGRRGG